MGNQASLSYYWKGEGCNNNNTKLSEKNIVGFWLPLGIKKKRAIKQYYKTIQKKKKFLAGNLALISHVTTRGSNHSFVVEIKLEIWPRPINIAW